MTTRFATNKWVGLAIPDGGQYINTAMFAYLQANGWGIWLEQGDCSNLVITNSDGTNNQAAVIANLESVWAPILTEINNNYTIPVRIDMNGFEIYNPPANTIASYKANFDEVMAYYEQWANGTLGNCLTQYWHEGSQGNPTIGQYLRQSTTRTIVWAYMAIWGPWTTYTTAQLNTLFSYADIVDIEMWWVSDTAATIPLINWILTNQPTKKIGIDTQINGGWPDQFHLWGQVWDGTDAEPTYAVQRTRCQTAVNAIKQALGRQFDSETAEVAGDSGDITQNAHTAPNGTVYPQGGWTTVQVMTEQLDFFDAQKWIKPAGGGNTTTLNPSTSSTISVTVSAASVASTLTISGPTTAVTGTAFTVSGKLTRNDTGAGVASQIIQLLRNGTASTTATTASDGTYSMSVTEAAAGTDTYQASFAGASV